MVLPPNLLILYKYNNSSNNNTPEKKIKRINPDDFAEPLDGSRWTLGLRGP